MIAAFDEQYSRAAAADNTSTQSDTLLATGSGARCAGCSGRRHMPQKCEKTCVLGNSNDFVSVRVVLFGFGSSKQLENNQKSVEIEFVFRGRSSGMKRALTGALWLERRGKGDGGKGQCVDLLV